jgi:hypothetical protein
MDQSLEARVLRAFPSDVDQDEVALRNDILDALKHLRGLMAHKVRNTRSAEGQLIQETASAAKAVMGRHPSPKTKLRAYGPGA